MRVDLMIAFAGMTLVTYLTRSLFTVFLSGVRVAPFWSRALVFVPLAVLTALVAPFIMVPSGLYVSILSPYPIAGIATLLLAHRSRNLLLSAVTGTALFLVLVRIFPA